MSSGDNVKFGKVRRVDGSRVVGQHALGVDVQRTGRSLVYGALPAGLIDEGIKGRIAVKP